MWNGWAQRADTVVDATLISAPSSTKNASSEHEPQMKQSGTGQQCYFGMKAHIRVDAASGLVRTVRDTTGRISDVVKAPTRCLRSDVLANGGCQGAHKRPNAQAHAG